MNPRLAGLILTSITLLISLPALAARADGFYRNDMMKACAQSLHSFTAQSDFHSLLVDRKLSDREGLCGPSCMVYTTFAAEKITDIKIGMNAVARMAVYKRLHEANPNTGNERFGAGLFAPAYPRRAATFFNELGLKVGKVEEYGRGYSGENGSLKKLMEILSGKNLKNAMPAIAISAWGYGEQGAREGGHFVLVTGHNIEEQTLLIIDPNDPWTEHKVEYLIKDEERAVIRPGSTLDAFRSHRGTLLLEDAYLIEFQK